MATFGPPTDGALEPHAPRATTFAAARFLIQQRCLGTLAHELGNIASPVALVAEVICAASPAQLGTVAGTLRHVSIALAHATTICRLLRGSVHAGALSPATIPDTTAWWALCAPYAADMLPTAASITANVAAATLTSTEYEALVWSAVATARYVGLTRPEIRSLHVTGVTSVARRSAFVLTIGATSPRQATVPAALRELARLASWEARRAGASVRTTDGPEMFECRITLPNPVPTSPARR